MRALAPALFCIAALLAGFSPTSAGVTVHHSRSVDFSAYATFAWLEGVPAPDPEVERQVRQAIEAQLTSKGLSKTEQSPDLYVRSMAGGHDGKVDDVDILGLPGEAERSLVPGDDGGETRRVTVGTLVVLLLDGTTKLQVWQGVATDLLDDNPKRSGKKAQKLIGKMFANYPPGAE